MPSVPHSGNECSGICPTPCDHITCWQCQEIKHNPKEAIKEVRKALDANRRKENANKSTFAPPTMFVPLTKEMSQKATITRAALEALTQRAGIAMDWNGGDPVFRDGGVIASKEERARGIERHILEGKIAELERISGTLQGKQISAAEARALSKEQIVDMDIKAQVEEIMRQQEQEILKQQQQRQKDSGATDEDIAAAEALLGQAPSLLGASTAAIDSWSDARLDPDRVQSMVSLKKSLHDMKAAMKANGLPAPTAVIVHPSTFRQVERS